MMNPLRDLLKHSSIYMIGQILTRMASILLLPLYTHCLAPADYGAIAILDLTCALLSTLIAGGMIPAIVRHHFDREESKHHDRVWWTGLTFVTLTAAVVCLPMWFFRQALADVTLGPDVIGGSWFYTLSAMTIMVAVVGQTIDAYLRVRKWSGIFVGISMGRLLLNIGLNIWFLVGLKMGVEGLLIGNLLAASVNTGALLLVFVRTRGPWCMDSEIGRQMMRFTAPLVITSVAAMMLHQVDHYLLGIYVSMDEVGVYALAHKIGFAVHTLCLLPFLSIWHVAIYDIEKMPNSEREFSRMFRWFVSGIGILLLGASLTVYPVLPWLTPDSYGKSIDLISVILLGFFLFGLSFQFEVPALLSKRTKLLVPGSILALAVNIGFNTLLIPVLGAWGAAWAGVITYAVYSFTILACCRWITKIEYPWKSSLMTSLALCGTFIVVRFGCFPYLGALGQLVTSVAVCAAWTIVLFSSDFYQWWKSRKNDMEISDEESSDQASAKSELVSAKA